MLVERSQEREARDAVGQPAWDVGGRLGLKDRGHRRRLQRPSAEPEEVRADLGRLALEALEEAVRVERACVEELAVELLEFADGEVGGEDDLEVQLPHAAHAGARLVVVGQQLSGGRADEVDRLHRRDVLADLGKPAPVPELAETPDHGSQLRLGPHRQLPEFRGHGARGGRRGVHVAVVDADLGPHRHLVPPRGMGEAMGDALGDELGLERQHLAGEVRALALPEEPLLPWRKVHREVGGDRNGLRARRREGGSHAAGLLSSGRVVIGLHCRRNRSALAHASSRSTGQPISSSSASASSAAIRASASSSAGMRATREGTATSRVPPLTGTVMRSLTATRRRTARSSRAIRYASGVTVPPTMLSPRPQRRGCP